jgi:branched-chain amino acid transport system substrate-binding protein
VQPVAQVGLLAPFEGMERRSGYGALAMLRAGIEQGGAVATPREAALLPLAIDTSIDAQRAAQKLLLSPNVAAVLGPLSPQQLPAADEAQQLHALGAGRWLAPFALTAAGFVAPDAPAWLQALVDGVTEGAAAQGATRLLIAGWAGDDLRASLAAEKTALPILWAEEPGALLAEGDTLLWLGDGTGAAGQAAALRATGAQNAIWLAPWAAGELFDEQFGAAEAAADSPWEGIFSTAWIDGGYAAWAAADPSRSPELYAQAVAAARIVELAAVVLPASDSPTPPAGAEGWRLQTFALTGAGERLPVAP